MSNCHPVRYNCHQQVELEVCSDISFGEQNKDLMFVKESVHT